LVDDEVAVLLTLKAVLEMNEFVVDVASSAREAKQKLRHQQYVMVITDMRMESDSAGFDVVKEAKATAYNPAVAILTAFPVDDDDWRDSDGADELLLKPMNVNALMASVEALLVQHEDKKQKAEREAGIAGAGKLRPGHEGARNVAAKAE
jgi:DNA-binding response OmpR family regulator